MCVSRPLQAVFTTLLQPISKIIQQVQSFREQNRTSPLFNHLSAVSESVPGLGWVAMVSSVCVCVCVCVCVYMCINTSLNHFSLCPQRCYCFYSKSAVNVGVSLSLSQDPKPGPYVKDMQDAAMFYTNRVLKDYKEK